MTRQLCLLLASLFLASACSSSSDADMGGADAASDIPVIMFDAGPDLGVVDLGTDAPMASSVGHACTSDTDCSGGAVCASELMTGLTGGYCTIDCTADGMCPADATCVPVSGMQSLCLLTCDSTMLDPRVCRMGYGCAGTMAGDVCLPGCTDATDCPTGTMCDPTGGGFGAGACYTTGAMVGQPCTNDAMCPMGGACLDEATYGTPAGECVTGGCDAASGSGCPGDAVCRPQRFGGGLCFDGCTIDADCRSAYHCVADATYPTRRYCAPHCTSTGDCTATGDVCNPGAGTCGPPFDPSDTGAACASAMATVDCAGGACLSERTTGFPNSACVYLGCTPGPDAADGCPGDGTCIATRAGTTLCLDHCATSATCRTGYACLPSDRADDTSPLACQPHCTADSQCQPRGGMPTHCNQGTGLCGAGLPAASEGRPCASAAECAGGVCLTESGDGYPGGGECVAVGCRLTGTGGTEACPAGSACVDDAFGDPEVGWCMVSCDTGTTTGCRTGYTCVGTGTGTEGICRPACTATDCTTPAACDTGTGLCVTP